MVFRRGVSPLRAFTAELGYSRYAYVEFRRGQEIERAFASRLPNRVTKCPAVVDHYESLVGRVRGRRGEAHGQRVPLKSSR